MLSLQTWLNRRASLVAAGWIVLFLVTGILTLPNYGMTWDEGTGNFFFGERYLHYFASFDPIHLNFAAELPYNLSHPLNLFHSPYHLEPNQFPAVADTLSAASMYLFSYGLGWLNPVDGFHLFTVILAAVFLWVLYCFAAPRLGKFEALLAVVLLSLFPRFWGDMHFNDKDVPETIFFSLVILAYITWRQNPRRWKAVLVGVLGGLALGTKANAIFIPVILVIGLVPWTVNLQSWKDLFVHLIRHWRGYVSMVLTAGIVYIASWPYLYADPYHRLKAYWMYILSQGDRVGDATFNIDPLRQVVFSMPEIMLAALLVGLVLTFARVKEPFWRILIAWLVFPILRASLPGLVNFDGIRHFLEFVPAAALIAGYGIGRATRWLADRNISVVFSRAVFAALLVVNMLGIYLIYFPYLHIYYNQLSGGLGAARNVWLGSDAGDYWASSHRQAMAWLNQNAPPGSIVRGMIANWTISMTAPLFLRPDMRVMTQQSLPDYNVMDQSDHPIYLIFVIRAWDQMDELEYCRTHKTPVYEISVDLVPILQIFKFGSN